jgi:hypothetical protein
MLAMLPRLKTTPPDRLSSYSTLMKKRILNVFVKGIFGYLNLLKVDTYNYVATSITGLFSFPGSLKSIQKSKNHQRRIFLDNYYRQRCLV